MALYRYKAVTAGGEVVEGEIDAPDRAGVIDRLHGLGYVPIRAEVAAPSRAATPARRRPPFARSLFARRRMTRRDVMVLTRSLATLVGAGVPLDRSLQILMRVAENEPARLFLSRVLERLQGGAPLADALAPHAGLLPGTYTAMVRAGEEGGALGPVLARLADFLERSQALGEAVRSALLYPAILLGMVAMTLALMIGVVLPQFETMFADAGDSLPVPAKLVLDAGRLAREWGWLALAALIPVGLGLRRAWRIPTLRRRLDGWVLRAPLVGGLASRVETARLARTLAVLLGNGVPLLAALGIVKETVRNAALRDGFDGLARGLKEGQGLADPLARLEGVPTLAQQLVRVGEETGRLESMLVKIADIYDQEVTLTLDRLLALLVPAVTILLGLVVAFVIGAILTALLSVYNLPI
ncbi:MAG TPA: type II secretion system F family protein [Azospirillaceae bacterium]|nr:type II secretion system F family protein [Azospirillaceae bacterium]